MPDSANLSPQSAQRWSTPRFLSLQNDMELVNEKDKKTEIRRRSNSKSTVVLPFTSPAKTTSSMDCIQLEQVNSTSRVTLPEDKRVLFMPNTGLRVSSGSQHPQPNSNSSHSMQQPDSASMIIQNN